MTECSVRFFVEGREISPGLIFISPMGLSRQRLDMIEHAFRLEIPETLLCKMGQPAWEERIALYKKEETEADAFDEDDWVAMAGYPPLKDIIHDQDELDLMFGVGGNLVHQTLPAIFQAHSWVMEQTDKPYYLGGYIVEKVGEVIVWTGTCFRNQ